MSLISHNTHYWSVYGNDSQLVGCDTKIGHRSVRVTYSKKIHKNKVQMWQPNKYAAYQVINGMKKMEWCFPNCFVWWTVGFQNIEIILKGHMMWFQVFLASSYDPFNWRDVYLHLRFTQMYVKIQKNRKHCDFKSSFVWKISVLCSVLKQTLLKTNGICNTSQEMILKYKLFKPFMHITLRVARGMKSFITIVHVKPLNYCWPFLDFFFFDLCVASVMLILWLDGCPALSSVFCQLISICHYQIVFSFCLQ